MANLAVLERQQQFDFQQNGIEVMDFETLQRKYPLIPTLWMIFEDSTFAFRSGDKHRSRRIYGK